MPGKGALLLGLCPAPSLAQEAIRGLRGAGFRSTEVCLAFAAAPDGAPAEAPGDIEWLSGLGVISLPGVPALAVTGPIASALAAAGSVGRAVAGIGMPEGVAARYEEAVIGGGLLLSVACDSADWLHRAKDILTRAGLSDLAVNGPAPEAGTQGSPPAAPPADDDDE